MIGQQAEASKLRPHSRTEPVEEERCVLVEKKHISIDAGMVRGGGTERRRVPGVT